MEALRQSMERSRAARQQTEEGADKERNGTHLAFLILALTVAIGLSPAGELAAYLYPTLTVAATAGLLARRRVDHALELNLWTWATAPAIRRLIDWSSGSFNESSPVLVTASMSALLLAASVLKPSRRVPLGFGLGFFAILTAALFATVIGVRDNGWLPAAISAILWIAPVMLGLVMLTAGEDLEARIEAVLRFSRWALLVLSTYAIVQWVLAPPWDNFWLSNAFPYATKLGSPFGQPEAFLIRPWSLFNSPFGFAHLLVWLLISQIGTAVRGRKVTYAGVVAGCLALGLTGIRSAWVTAALTVAILAVYRQVRVTRFIALLAATAIVTVTVFSPAAEEISRRIGTAGSAASDVSVLARIEKYNQALPPFLADFFGAGMGSTGSGARADLRSDQGFTYSLDSSYLEVLRVNGSILGICTISAVLLMSVAAFRRSRWRSPPLPAWGAMALVIPIDMFLGGVLDGPQAVVTWIVIGTCGGAPGQIAKVDPHTRSTPSRRGHLQDELGTEATSA